MESWQTKKCGIGEKRLRTPNLKRGSRKIEILYLEAKLQLKLATAHCRIA